MERMRRILAERRSRYPTGRAGADACLVTVIRTAGSTPRHPGAMMVVDAAGTANGSIGGGRVEHEITERARAVAAGAPPERIEHHLVRDLGMCCGGSMEFLLSPLPAAEEGLNRALDIVDGREVAVLRLHLVSGVATAEVASSDTPRRAELEADEFILTLRPRERAILFGAGHVSAALGPLLEELGFEVVVCDDNETGAVESEPTWAARLVTSFDLRDIVRDIGPLGALDYALVLTRDHAIDLRIVEELLVEPVGYLGLIASRRKVETFRKRLLAKELFDEERWKRLHSPVGFDIGAETPMEIAVAIAAEMVGHRHGRSEKS